MNTHADTVPQRIAELGREPIAIVAYDPAWPGRYTAEEERLRNVLPADLCTGFAHIGSTAVPGLSAKPIIDIQVEVFDLDRVRSEVVPVMRGLGYEFIWRPSMGERAPFYAWFIGRDAFGDRAYHVHMVQPDRATADRLLFRDLLRMNKAAAMRYEALKQALVAAHPNDREAYTRAKEPFIVNVLDAARRTHRDRWAALMWP
jgi:GrpB-like predicted nucleotidyltransferase (UPF0157 family)